MHTRDLRQLTQQRFRELGSARRDQMLRGSAESEADFPRNAGSAREVCEAFSWIR